MGRQINNSEFSTKHLTKLMFLTFFAVFLGASSGYAQINEREYANVRGWQILATTDGNRFAYCGAITADSVAGMDQIQIAYDGTEWKIGRNDQTVNQYYGSMLVGNVRTTLNFTKGRSYWIAADLTHNMVREIKSAGSMQLQIHSGDRLNYSMSGSTAALLKVEECVRNFGRRGVRQSARPAPRKNNVRPAPKRQQAQHSRRSHIQNYWKKNQYLNVETGRIASTRIQQGWHSAQWILEPVAGNLFLFRLKNRYTSQYLHNQYGRLEMGNIQKGWHSAQWHSNFSTIGTNVVNLQNRWTKQYLHIEHGYLELGNINKGWHSAGWLIR